MNHNLDPTQNKKVMLNLFQHLTKDSEINSEGQNHNFETFHQTLEQIKNFLDNNIDNFITTTVFQDERNINELLAKIQQKFNLKNFPYKIICLDISHDSGKNPAGGISAMLGGILSKKNYRHIKIPEELGGNDYESLKYCLIKYFKNNTADLVILDGGKGQLNIVNDLPNEIVLNTDFISIGKGKARTRKGKIAGQNEYFFTFEKQIPIDYNLLEDKLLIKLRDEAHRFANKYRTKIGQIKNKK